MSELINTQNRHTVRWRLLSTVSALALLASACAAGEAMAADNDADRPTIWIELGGGMEHVGGQGDAFSPGFLAVYPNSPAFHPISPIQAQNPPPFSFGEEGKITFQPENSAWVFLIGANFGRSSSFKHIDHQTHGTHARKYVNNLPVTTNGFNTQANFADSKAHSRESHAVLDFSVGRDVGIGMFGKDASSIISFGVRAAQFSSRKMFDVRSRPDLDTKYFPSKSAPTRVPLNYFHTYHATGQASRSFRGIGPSLSWNGSAPVVGNKQRGEVTFDWGANGAVLFGKQKASVQHHESGHYEAALAELQNQSASQYVTAYPARSNHSTRSRSIILPNVGGFAGASYRIENFKVSLGYRADFFFGAIDGGIDARKSETLGFYGPFASVSVGLGG